MKCHSFSKCSPSSTKHKIILWIPYTYHPDYEIDGLIAMYKSMYKPAENRHVEVRTVRVILGGSMVRATRDTGHEMCLMNSE